VIVKVYCRYLSSILRPGRIHRRVGAGGLTVQFLQYGSLGYYRAQLGGARAHILKCRTAEVQDERSITERLSLLHPVHGLDQRLTLYSQETIDKI